MSEYFKWANFDKHKVLSNDLWGDGISLSCFTYLGSVRNDAVATLLAGPWAGDRVILCGDYARFRDDDACEVRRNLASLGSDNLPYDWDDDPECEAAGLFRAARGLSREVWLYGGEAVTLPFEGPFSLEPRRVRYVINETKLEFVDRFRGPVLRVFPNRVDREDLFAVLCCSGDVFEDFPDGRWFGDRLRASDERPDPGYRDVTALYEYRGEATTLSDEEILSAYASSAADGSCLDVENGGVRKLLRSVGSDKQGKAGSDGFVREEGCPECGGKNILLQMGCWD